MHWLNTGYGIWFNWGYRREGALFQGRYKAILFDPDECLLAVHYYIHLSPVRVGILKAVDAEEATVDKTYCLSGVRGCAITSGVLIGTMPACAGRLSGNNARAIAIWFARHQAGIKLEQVREQLQARSYTAVAMQVCRLQRQLPHQPQLRRRL